MFLQCFWMDKKNSLHVVHFLCGYLNVRWARQVQIDDKLKPHGYTKQYRYRQLIDWSTNCQKLSTKMTSKQMMASNNSNSNNHNRITFIIIITIIKTSLSTCKDKSYTIKCDNHQCKKKYGYFNSILYKQTHIKRPTRTNTHTHEHNLINYLFVGSQDARERQKKELWPKQNCESIDNDKSLRNTTCHIDSKWP